MIEALPELLETDHNATIARIIPKIQQELPNSSSEFHIATSNIFKLLFDMKLSINLLRPVLQGIESRDPIIANAWIDTLLAVIQNLSQFTLMNEVMVISITITFYNIYALELYIINKTKYYSFLCVITFVHKSYVFPFCCRLFLSH